MKNLPKIVLVVVVASCLAFACSVNKAATLGGAGAGAGIGAAVGGPVGAAVGGLAGAAGGDALVDDPAATTTINNIDARGAGRVDVRADKAATPEWYMNPWVWLAAYLAFRFRAGLLAFGRSLLTGGVKAALLTLGGLLWGGKAADAAKEAVAEHEESSPRAMALRRLRRRAPPAKIVDSEVKPHA